MGESRQVEASAEPGAHEVNGDDGADGARTFDALEREAPTSAASAPRPDDDLRAERDRFAALAAAAPGAIFTYRETPDGSLSFPYLSGSIEPLFGYPRELLQAEPRRLFSRVHRADFPHVASAAEASRRDLTPWYARFRVLHPTRGEIWVEGNSRPLRDASGGTTWHGFFVDITERKSHEEALRASEERYRSLVELLPDAVVITRDDRITFCNAAFVRLMGADGPRSLIGLSPFDILHPEHHESVRARLDTLPEHQNPAMPFEESIVTLDGARRWVRSFGAAIVDQGAPAFLAVMHDVTEQRKLEEQFRQAHKMEAFGQLAGGVAHDFNNLLTIILGLSSECLEVLPPGDETAAAIAEIRAAGERAASLTRQLLAFSRKTVLDAKVLDVDVVVRETEQLLRRLIGEDIRLSTELGGALPRVRVDPGQLAQVLMNLAVNARDAMPRGGTLAIATAAVQLDANEARTLSGLAAGRFVKISVSDTGTGMTEAVRDRVFQPFFTTKPVGEGTGLGLAVVHGIVTQSGGAIRLETELGRGTTWEIFLPEAANAASPEVAVSPPVGGEAIRTVLVVEDDDAVRRLAQRLLARRGQRVLLASSGGEALALLEREHGSVDLVITDVVMPHMDGSELAEHIRERFPSVKILFVSGYTDATLVRRGLQSETLDFLPKPYTARSLTEAVDRLLTRARSQE